MTTETKRSYTTKFKREAVKLVTERGYKFTEAARHLGIHANVLGRWKREIGAPGQGVFPGKEPRSSEQEELHHLREENRRLKI